jgi:hypothetical protein
VNHPDLAVEGLQRATRTADSPQGEIRYRCQATELARFSTPISSIEPTQYVRDLTSGNVALKDFVLYSSRAILQAARRKLISPTVWEAVKRFLRRARGLTPGAEAAQRSEGGATVPKLDLRQGELVRVRPLAEITATLDEGGKNRGLSFDPDMSQRVGGVFRVAKRVEKVIDEKSGKMLRIRRDCIILDGVSCKGTHNCSRLFCPRGALQFWRECWLERLEEGAGAHVATCEGAIDKKAECV